MKYNIDTQKEIQSLLILYYQVKCNFRFEVYISNMKNFLNKNMTDLKIFKIPVFVVSFEVSPPFFNYMNQLCFINEFVTTTAFDAAIGFHITYKKLKFNL